ncbi:MAG: DMT family transporter [Desulfobacteraceae bacterium]|nr:DMT family transporter [Desulfobacteraceae bacterium]
MDTLQNRGQTEGKWISSRMKGLFMTLLGAFCFSLIPIWVRAIEAYSSMSIAFFRALIGMIFLFFWIVQRREAEGIIEVRLLGWKYKLVLICVGFAMCLTPVTYYLAIMKTSVAKAVLLHYTAPIHVAILSPFILKEKNTVLTWIAVGTGLLGTALITEPASLFKGDYEEIQGIVSALISGLGLAGIFMFGRFLAGHIPAQVRALWGCVIVAIILLPFGISVPSSHFCHNLPFLAMLGTVSLAVPYTLFFKGANYITAQASSVASLFEPVCGIAIGFLFFGESLSPVGFAGAGIVLISIYIASRR